MAGVEPLRREVERLQADRALTQDVGTAYSVVYYRDQAGKGALKAYYTSDVRVEPRQAAAGL